jgi:hypothetical protein
MMMLTAGNIRLNWLPVDKVISAGKRPKKDSL